MNERWIGDRADDVRGLCGRWRRRGSMPTAAAVAALAAMSACAARGAFAAGPDAIGDAQAGGDAPAVEFSVQTTLLVEAFGGNLADGVLWDRGGDGVIDDRDFLTWFLGYGFDAPVPDADGDGEVSVQDVIVRVAVVLSQLVGDLDADGVVDATDVTLVTQIVADPNQAAFPQQGDVSGDGVVDQRDVDLVIDALGDRLSLSPLDAAGGIVAYFGLGPYAEIHVQSISDGWAPGHDASESKDDPQFKPNHDVILSRGWRNPDPNTPFQDGVPKSHHREVSRVWPANHLQVNSATWPPAKPSHIPFDTPERHLFHYEDESRLWPPNHDASVTGQWYPAHEHEYDGESPQPHVVGLSRLWPPNHVMRVSRKNYRWVPTDEDNDGEPDHYRPNRPRSPHLRAISSSYPRDHSETDTRAVPSNHHHVFTNTWEWHLIDHSAYWPAGHMKPASATWPAQRPVRWPIGHYAQYSKVDPQEQQPPESPWPPIFPEGHDVWTTAQDLLPYLPNPGDDDE